MLRKNESPAPSLTKWLFLKKSYETSLEEKVCALGSQQKLNLGIGKVKLAGGDPIFQKKILYEKYSLAQKKNTNAYICDKMNQKKNK